MTAALRDEFDAHGFVRIDGAVASPMAARLRARMDEALKGRAPNGVVKLGDDAKAAPVITTEPLCAAYDALLGQHGWVRPEVLEDRRVKFPAAPHPPWWHIDVFERGPNTQDDDLLSWRSGPGCGGVGLLVVLLLSDVGPNEAATAFRAGSHRAVARHLAERGEGGLSLGELLALGIDEKTADAPVFLSTGPAGTAFLCDPRLVHAGLPNTADAPSYWALPAIRRVGPSTQ